MENLIGKKIVIYSDAGGSERQDIGILVSIEGPWLSIRKGENEFQHFSIHKIRMVKLFEI